MPRYIVRASDKTGEMEESISISLRAATPEEAIAAAEEGYFGREGTVWRNLTWRPMNWRVEVFLLEDGTRPH